MKVAIRENEVFIDYAERFGDAEIEMPPYNYTVTELPDDIEYAAVEYGDFNIKDGDYVFDRTKYEERIAAIKNGRADLLYKTVIESKIRERYTISDELAILRQRDIKKKEFDAYYQYVENVKANIKRNFIDKDNLL